jgi:serine/threonine protein phosphatase PrpC
VILKGSNLFMGYIGDSRAIMGSKDSNDSMVAVQLTVDLKPDLPSRSYALQLAMCFGGTHLCKPMS